jgi:hypothetical protein
MIKATGFTTIVIKSCQFMASVSYEDGTLYQSASKTRERNPARSMVCFIRSVVTLGYVISIGKASIPPPSDLWDV